MDYTTFHPHFSTIGTPIQEAHLHGELWEIYGVPEKLS